MDPQGPPAAEPEPAVRLCLASSEVHSIGALIIRIGF